MEPRHSVVVLYNQVGEDEYEKIRTIDPSTLDFKPEYDIHVSTIQEEYDAIVEALRKEGFRARAANIEEDLTKLERLLKRSKPDVVFNLVEFFNDDSKLEAAVAGLFDLHKVSYTGAPPFALSVCQRKGLTKQILLANGVPTPRFHLLQSPEIRRKHHLRYPLIVKPAREDASTGVDKGSVVHDYDALSERLQKMFKEFGPPVLVEEFIEGRELHISVLGNHPPRVLPPIEFDFSELPPDYPHLITYDAKWNPLDEAYHRVHSMCPAKLSKAALRKVTEACVKAYEVVGCRDYARLDVRIGRRNQVFVLEVNPNPDLTEGVSYMDSAEKAGLTFSSTLRQIVEFALKRKQDGLPHHH
jgi:D-alanine-D-alanine ligase